MRPLFVKLMTAATLAGLAVAADAQTFPWNTLSPTTNPSSRERVGSATDGTRVYVYGGQVNTTTSPYANLLAFDGTNWTELTAAGSGAGPRSSPVMAWDAARGKLVVFGGKGDAASWNNYLQDTWEWDTTNGWLQIGTASVPDKRWLTNGVYVPGIGVVFHGGNSQDAGGVTYTDSLTWAYDGSNWSAIALGPTLQNGVLVYRSTTHDLIYACGNSVASSTAGTDTWRLDLGTMTWSQIVTATLPTSDNATGGPGLTGPTGYFNEATGKVVLHGGQGNGGPPSSLTWEFDGTDWTEVSWAGTAGLRNAPGQWLAATQKGYALCGNSANSAKNWTQEHGPVTYGSFTVANSGCPTSGGLTETLSSSTMPSINENLELNFDNQTPGTVHYLSAGTSLFPAPLSLKSLLPGSAPGCALHVNPNVAFLFFPATTVLVPIPNSPSLIGFTVYMEALQIEVGPPKSGSNSNYAKVTFGQLQ